MFIRIIPVRHSHQGYGNSRQQSKVRGLRLPKFAILWIKLLPDSDQVGFDDSRDCNDLAVPVPSNLDRERAMNVQQQSQILDKSEAGTVSPARSGNVAILRK